jgi:hypothetical protein
MEQRLAAHRKRQRETEEDAMAKDDRPILELLKDELAFIEQGGYGRSVRTPWLPKSAFQDSLTCINYSDPARTRPCNDCQLIDFVSNQHQSEEVPCHFIALNDAGETIEDLEAQGNQAKLEATVKQWMRARIKQIEDEQAKSEASL